MSVEAPSAGIGISSPGVAPGLGARGSSVGGIESGGSSLGPASFFSSESLFASTSPMGQVSSESFEGIVSGVDPFSDIKSIWQAPEITLEPGISPTPAEVPVFSSYGSLLSSTEPIKLAPIESSEGPLDVNPLEDTQVIWSRTPEIFPKPAESVIADLLGSVAPILERTAAEVPSVMAQILEKGDIPAQLTAYQTEHKAPSVLLQEQPAITQDNGATLVRDITQTAEEVSRQLPISQKPELNTNIEQQISMVEASMKKPKPEISKQEETPKKFVVDEEANEEREKNALAAVRAALQEIGTQEEVSGKEVKNKMSDAPTREEMSEIAIEWNLSYDGSFDEMVNSIADQTFTEASALTQIKKLINEKPAVKEEDSGQEVSPEDVSRVTKMPPPVKGIKDNVPSIKSQPSFKVGYYT